eukprot:8853377-Pyramimonas_sp.AAC.1
MEQWFDAAESALGRMHGQDDKQYFGRAKGCQAQLAPLEASRGQELHRRSLPGTQRWLSLRRLTRQYMKAAAD